MTSQALSGNPAVPKLLFDGIAPPPMREKPALAGSHDDEVVAVARRLLHDRLADDWTGDDAHAGLDAGDAEAFDKSSYPPGAGLTGDSSIPHTAFLDSVEDDHLGMVMRGELRYEIGALRIVEPTAQDRH